MEEAGEQAHHNQVAEQRDRAVAEVKAEQSFHCFRCRCSRCGKTGSIGPGKMLVPEKIVQHRPFNRQCGCQEVVHTLRCEHGQYCELNSYADAAYEREFEPSPGLQAETMQLRRRVHAIRSSL